jgi:hypothetical protein
LRIALLEGLAPQIEKMCDGDVLDPALVRNLAEVLGLLGRLGWRPAGRGIYSLSRMWQNLAFAATDAVDRRRWLISALEVADSHEEAERIRSMLMGDGESH